MKPVLVAPFSTPSSDWDGFKSPLIKFQHGDFFTKGLCREGMLVCCPFPVYVGV
jgi:hypothetical protein